MTKIDAKTSRLQTIPMAGYTRPEMRTRVRVSINTSRIEPIRHGRIFWLVYDNRVIAEGRDANPDMILSWAPNPATPIANRLAAFANLVKAETFRATLPDVMPAHMVDHPSADLRMVEPSFIACHQSAGGDSAEFRPDSDPNKAQAAKTLFLSHLLGLAMSDRNKTVEWVTRAAFYVVRSGMTDARLIFDTLVSFLNSNQLFMPDRLIWENATTVINNMPREYRLPKVRPTDMFRLTAKQTDSLISKLYYDVPQANGIIDQLTEQRERERAAKVAARIAKFRSSGQSRNRVPLAERMTEPYILGRRIYLPTGQYVAYLPNMEMAEAILTAVRTEYAERLRKEQNELNGLA
jgi:hypothetical protein